MNRKMPTAEALDVVIPTSPEEAAKAFGDGKGVTIIGGGTIVVPDITYGRLRPNKVLMIARSGLDQVTRAKDAVTIGAAAPVSALEQLDEPLASAAQHVGDPEIRAQATVGGNLCASHSGEAPRGDLQAPLIVLGARVRSTGKGGEKVEPVEDFLAGDAAQRLVLDVSYDDVQRKAGYAAARRPHAHHYTILAVAAAEANGELRVAATGLGPHAVRLFAVEQSRKAEDALKDAANPQDDALASSWYRRTVLPKLVEQALADL
jgi:carbon-monoxide dehydrogenase medium subunit